MTKRVTITTLNQSDPTINLIRERDQVNISSPDCYAHFTFSIEMASQVNSGLAFLIHGTVPFETAIALGKVQVKNDRLREALRSIVTRFHHGGHDTAKEDDMARIAKKALEPST